MQNPAGKSGVGDRDCSRQYFGGGTRRSRERLQELPIERWKIRRLTAGDPVPVQSNFLVHPIAAGVANIV
jgi:hypothetical protein